MHVHFIDIACCIHTIWLCFWSFHTNNSRIYQLGDYDEETVVTIGMIHQNILIISNSQ